MENGRAQGAVDAVEQIEMHILLIGPDALRLASYKKALEADAFVVDLARDDVDGKWKARAEAYAAIVLEVIASGADRFATLKAIRRTNDRPVLVLTPRDTVVARMQGIEAGASDFLVTPFAAADLVSRLRAMLKQSPSGKRKVLRIANLKVDLKSQTCFRNGKQVDLAPTEFALLVALLHNRDRDLSRASLLREVWNADIPEESNVVEVTVRRLRIKLDNPFEVKLLHTVRGVGYILQDRSGLENRTAQRPAPASPPPSNTSTVTEELMGIGLAERVAQEPVFLPSAKDVYPVGVNMDLWKRNNVWISGEGAATIIFAHGFGCDQSMWRLTAPMFRNRFRTILFDHVGSGSSDLSAYDRTKYDSLRGYSDDVNELLDKFAEGPTIFIGHSVSAMIGMLADLQAPGRIAGHVMVSPSPCYVNDGDYVGGFEPSEIDQLLVSLENNYLGWSQAMAPVIMGAPNQPSLREELTNSFCSTDPDIAKHFARVTFLSDHRADLARLSTPTLLLQCDDDVIAPVAVGEYMHRVLPRSTLRVVNNIGHCPHLSAPHECMSSIEDFLIQIADRGR